MRIEREYDGRPAKLARAGHHPPDNLCVTSVNAVKIAYRERPAAQLVWQAIDFANEFHYTQIDYVARNSELIPQPAKL